VADCDTFEIRLALARDRGGGRRPEGVAGDEEAVPPELVEAPEPGIHQQPPT
jgi:hypothetical protein